MIPLLVTCLFHQGGLDKVRTDAKFVQTLDLSVGGSQVPGECVWGRKFQVCGPVLRDDGSCLMELLGQGTKYGNDSERYWLWGR